MNVILTLLSLLSFFLVGILFYTWIRFRKSIYVHANLNEELIRKYPLEKQLVSFVTKDNETIKAWYIPVKNPKAVVILVHGFTDKNGGKSLMLPHAGYLKENGYSTLLIDLRATGESTGKKVYLGTKEWMDVETAYDWLKTNPENKHLKIGYFGISMGAVTTINSFGITGKGDFLVASVPYSSFKKQFSYEINKIHLPVLLFYPILSLAAAIEFGFDYQKYEPIKLITRIKKPVFLIIGNNDTDVGSEQGKNLYNAANEPKQLWLAQTQHDVHNELPDEFAKRFLEFLYNICESKSNTSLLFQH